MARNLVYFAIIYVITVAVLVWGPGQSQTAWALLIGQQNPETLAAVSNTQQPDAVDQANAELPEDLIADRVELGRVVQKRLQSGETMYEVLLALGFSARDALKMIAAAKPHHNLGRLAKGTEFTARWEPGAAADAPPTSLSIRVSDLARLELAAVADGWNANLDQIELTTKPMAFAGAVTSNLWSSASRAGMPPELINRLAEVFAWQVDFSREVQIGDRWRLRVDQRLADGRPVGWGDIRVAEYEHMGTVYSAVHFEHEDVQREYFAPDGNSMKRLFLKSPLRFGRVTSKFNPNRFHPILKVKRPHLGVDYGAPQGTPIMSVGHGVVTFAKMRGASGNMVRIRHNSVYQTAYKHLKDFGPGIKVGAKVTMGQKIGTVGKTGLATGPHLHFEFYKHGRVVDPLGIKFPSADPIPPKLMPQYQQHAQEQLAALPPWPESEGHTNVAVEQDGENQPAAEEL